MEKVNLQKVINFCHKYIPQKMWGVGNDIITIYGAGFDNIYRTLYINEDTDGFLIRKSEEYPHDIYEDINIQCNASLDDVFKEIKKFLSWEQDYEIEFPKKHYTMDDLLQKYKS